METTETRALTPESAVDLLVQPEETSEPVEEVMEAEEAQPEQDATNDAEVTDEAEEDYAEESIDDSEEEDEYEETEYEAAEEEPDTNTYYAVKVDGQEVQVTLDQLKQGYSGQQYVQKGMQQAAEARKQAEASHQALTQERQQLQQLVGQLQNGAITPPVEPVRSEYQNDPIGYMEAKMEYEDQVQKWGAVQQQLQAQTQAEQQARQALAQQEAQILMDKIPELRDADKATQFRNDIVQVATEVYGYPQELLGSITSHRDLMVLRDAMMYRKMMANGDKVQQKAKKAKQPIKPGSKRVTTNRDVERKKLDNLKKSGSMEAALAAMLK